MDPVLLRDYQVRLEEWLSQGYQLMVDEVEGQLRITIHYISRPGEVGREREQEFWPLTPEIVDTLQHRGIVIARPLSAQ